ncbi:MAG: hypothetical protein VKI82_04625 [Leptolyngbya sp.]|nr:hypothetical protein [Leptolyngbya sp.]
MALADDAVLDAAPGCRLVLAPGVCVGSGVIIQAIRGDVIIEPGAVLGSGVLIVGTGRIGQNACIGAESTLINPALPSGQVVPPHSLIGDPSQSSGNGATPDPVTFKSGVFVQAAFQSEVLVQEVPSQQVPSQAACIPETFVQETSVQETLPEDPPENLADAAPPPSANLAETEAVTGENLDTAQPDSPNATNGTRPPAHGQKQVQDLLAKLFPHRQPLN